MIVNGVTLPDIPAEVLAEKPNAVILWSPQEVGSDGYMLFLTKGEIVYLPPSILGTSSPYLKSTNNGFARYMVAYPNNATEWILQAEMENYLMRFELLDTFSPVWANLDIYECTSLNLNTGAFTKGDIWFPNSETPKPSRYSIATAILDDIAHAIQEKKNTTAVFTPESMPGEIRGIVSGDELPNAEDALWGTVANYEYGITSSVTSRTNSNKVHDGRKFKVNYTISFVGFRYYPCSTSSCVLTLYDADTQEVLERVTVTPPVTNEWVNYVLPEPRNLDTEKSYMISIFSNGNFAELSTDKVKYNNKITVTGNTYSYSADVYPQSSVYNTGGVDMLIGEIVTETIPTEYKIQLGTMTSIADEVMRIVGSDVQMSTEQIITALQSVEAQTATTEE